MSNNAEIMKFAHDLSVNVSTLPHKGQEITLISNDAQRATLAQNHGLVAVEHFEMTCHLQPRRHGHVHLSGSFTATVVQNCVISGDAITNVVQDTFTLLFVPQQAQVKKEHEIILTVETQQDDVTEFFDGTHIDLSAVVEEFFELALDPYPRRPEAEFHPVQIGETPEEKPPSPFAGLKKLATPQ